jgi:hypothetical protein
MNQQIAQINVMISVYEIPYRPLVSVLTSIKDKYPKPHAFDSLYEIPYRPLVSVLTSIKDKYPKPHAFERCRMIDLNSDKDNFFC